MKGAHPVIAEKGHVNHTSGNRSDTEIREIIEKEIARQRNNLILIASENFTSQEVIRTMGSVLTNKYAEGYPGFRYYAGCENMDSVEDIARNRAMELFGSNYSNVQPHSGVNANMAVFLAVLKCGDRVLSMSLRDGGHLSHGHKQNLSGKYFDIHTYSVNPETEQLDYDEIKKIARVVKPHLIIAGASSYSRIIDYSRFREIADETGAYLMADTAHIAGLMVTGYHPNSVKVADFTTATTHKTIRGPRGGLIIADKKYAGIIDRAVFPGVQGGPLMHIIAAKAVAFREALQDSFKDYARRIIENSKALCDYMKDQGFRIVSGGTDNHLFLIDLTTKSMTGFEAVGILTSVGIIINKNVIPFDKLDPTITSGIRIGTPAVTTQGMGKAEMHKIGECITGALKNRDKPAILKEIAAKVKKLANEFPVYENFEV
ncbi:MAG: serine hydroxymethyltransferase [Actinobacteria bacterium]|nr:serine hydroxymethyltransferase [Actinomycetota bacterium]